MVVHQPRRPHPGVTPASSAPSHCPARPCSRLATVAILIVARSDPTVATGVTTRQRLEPKSASECRFSATRRRTGASTGRARAGRVRLGKAGTARVCAADGHRCSERQGNGSSRNPHRNVAFLPHDDARAHRQAGHGRAGFDSGRQARHGTGMRGRRAPLLGSLLGRYRAREAACMSPYGLDRPGPPPRPEPRSAPYGTPGHPRSRKRFPVRRPDSAIHAIRRPMGMSGKPLVRRPTGRTYHARTPPARSSPTGRSGPDSRRSERGRPGRYRRSSDRRQARSHPGHVVGAIFNIRTGKPHKHPASAGVTQVPHGVSLASAGSAPMPSRHPPRHPASPADAPDPASRRIRRSHGPSDRPVFRTRVVDGWRWMPSWRPIWRTLVRPH